MLAAHVTGRKKGLGWPRPSLRALIQPAGVEHTPTKLRGLVSEISGEPRNFSFSSYNTTKFSQLMMKSDRVTFTEVCLP